jgi:hypothetical protein
MSLRRIIYSLLAVCLSLVGLACGLLCLICLIAYVLLHGLGLGSAVLALLCLSCLGLAVMLSGRAAKRESSRLGDAGLRSVKSLWPFRSGTESRSMQTPHLGSLDGVVEPSASTGDGAPARALAPRTEDLRPYGRWSERVHDAGPSQYRNKG